MAMQHGIKLDIKQDDDFTLWADMWDDDLDQYGWFVIPNNLWKRVVKYFGSEDVQFWNAFSTCCFNVFYEIGCELQPGRRNWPSRRMILLKDRAGDPELVKAARRWRDSQFMQLIHDPSHAPPDSDDDEGPPAGPPAPKRRRE